MSVERPCVLVGVTGCIAVYKACEVVRGLQKAGVRVKVVMTEHATEFVGPTTFRALTHEPVAVGLFDDPSDPIHHISLAQECDVFLIAPCTANVMAKVAHGIADDLLTTTALATTATLAIAPAANVHMYEAPITQENMEALRRRGVHFIEGDSGYLACGDVGRGRLADPAIIVRETLTLLEERLGVDALAAARERYGEALGGATGADLAKAGTGARTGKTNAEHAGVLAANASAMGVALTHAGGGENAAPAEGCVAADSSVATPTGAGALAGKTVLVTAGPTVEPIDSVRYISNYSSGKMGYSIAEAAAAAGARVVLVSGPVALEPPAGVDVVSVKSARDMLIAASEVFPAADAAVFAAAVADLRPANPADHKLKKGRDDAALASIQLTENPDILATLAAQKHSGQYVVGFAAETNDVLANARAKLAKKNADVIVANQVGDGLAFGTDDNQVWLVTAEGECPLPLMSKHDIARRLVEVIAEHVAKA